MIMMMVMIMVMIMITMIVPFLCENEWNHKIFRGVKVISISISIIITTNTIDDSVELILHNDCSSFNTISNDNYNDDDDVNDNDKP